MDRKKLEVVALMIEDLQDRNELPTDLSPYKTRETLATRNVEHAKAIRLLLSEALRSPA